MSGQKVDLILEWSIDKNGVFSAKRLIRWPMLRTIPDNTHAALSRRFSTQDEPTILVNGKPQSAAKTKCIEIYGTLKVTSQCDQGLSMERTIFPSMLCPSILDIRRITNTTNKPILLTIPSWRKQTKTKPKQGVFGAYVFERFLIGEGTYRLAPNETKQYTIVHAARKQTDSPYFGSPTAELASRMSFLKTMETSLVLETPNPVLNRLFAYSKIHATESIFSTRGGLMHAPGGYGKYLAAVWANDQAEYINPFFPFLGYSVGNESALNSFRHFARYMNPTYKPIPSSIIAEGRSNWHGAGDRGDMAMIAYGASRFALASGNRKWGHELWPLIQWCLEYCKKQKLPEGVIASRTDELENRFPAGKANLCTSSLYYDALISSAHLARELGKKRAVGETYLVEAKELKAAIAKYFHAKVEGFDTYRYYKANTALRSWICIPLTVGLYDRLEGTVSALLSPRLWIASGLLTKSGTKIAWDRSTLYALRGILAAGKADLGIQKLIEFSKTRLLGKHVPYVIEAFPEQNQSHLSAESGLYCRIFTEGLFGIRPTGLHQFECTPHLPKGWDTIALRRIHAFGQVWSLKIVRDKKGLKIHVTNRNNDTLYLKSLPAGQTHSISLQKQRS
jgi:hypothetical protein